jgi:hypothetical protein
MREPNGQNGNRHTTLANILTEFIPDYDASSRLKTPQRYRFERKMSFDSKLAVNRMVCPLLQYATF